MKLLHAIHRRLCALVARIPSGAARECCLCGHRLGRFLPYRGGWRAAPPLARALELIGSDLDHYLCPWCGANDRERHLWLYLTRGGILAGMEGRAVLHFAPEPRLTPRLQQVRPARHVQADLFPAHSGIERVDLLAMPYPDASFDMVMANHVLEHVSDELAAVREIRRVLRPGGLAVLQTPFSGVLEHTISDPGVKTAEARLQLYGQEDHARIFGRDIFERICSAGLVSRVRSHDEALPDVDGGRFGVNRREPFFLFTRA